jgi:hypothetical protein
MHRFAQPYYDYYKYIEIQFHIMNLFLVEIPLKKMNAEFCISMYSCEYKKLRSRSYGLSKIDRGFAPP